MEHEEVQFEQAQDYLSQIEGELKERVWKTFSHPLVMVMAPNGAEPHRQVLLDGRACVEDYATWSYHWAYGEGQFLPEKSFVGVSLLSGTDDPEYPNNFLFADMMFPQGEGIILTPDKLEGLEMLRQEFVNTNAHFAQAEFRVFFGRLQNYRFFENFSLPPLRRACRCSLSRGRFDGFGQGRWGLGTRVAGD